MRSNYENEAFYTVYLRVTHFDSTTPFVAGINAILIPKSIFTNTYLHRLIQQQDTDTMESISTSLVESDFSSIGKDTSITENIEGTISVLGLEVLGRYFMFSSEADAILGTILSNATHLDSKVYTYIQTSNIEDFNLADDIIEAIPFKNLSNGPIASGDDEPTTGFLGHCKIGIWAISAW